jgi:hypothetical protein
VYRKKLLFELRPWEAAKVTDSKYPDCALICWAIRNNHVSLLHSVSETASVALSEYFLGVADWFGSKNKAYLRCESQEIVDISTIALPDLQQMTESPDLRAIFFFLHDACTRGFITVVREFVLNLSKKLESSPQDSGRSSVQLSCEYFLIEAAACAQEAICSFLLPFCDQAAYTM